MSRTVLLVCVLLFEAGFMAADETSERMNLREPDYKKPPEIHIDKDLAPIQIPGFDSEYVQSGPILFISNYEIFISNINFNKPDLKASFLIGKDLSDNKEKILALSSYNGNNLILKLPPEYPVQSIKVLSIYSETNDSIIEDISFDVTEDVPDYLNKIENQEILRVPKCCPMDESLISDDGCVKNDSILNLSINILDNNETHLNDIPLNASMFKLIPYQYSSVFNCQIRFPLEHESSTEEGDKFDLLKNGSLILNNNIIKSVLPQGRFCVDNDETGETKIFVCYVLLPTSASVMNTVNVVLLFVSMICLIVVAILYYFVLYDTKDIHKQIFTIYSVIMALNYLLLIILYYLNYCDTLGYVVQFLLLMSYIWVFLLCIDVLYLISRLKIYDTHRVRLIAYVVISIVLAVVILAVTACVYKSPNLPSGIIRVKDTHECNIKEHSVFLFSVPCGVFLTASFLSLAVLKSKIIKCNKIYRDDVDWVENKMKYNFMFRQCLMLAVVVTIAYLAGLLTYIPEADSSFILSFTIIQSLQGLFILLITVLHNIAHNKKPRAENGNVQEMARLNSWFRAYLILAITMVVWLLNSDRFVLTSSMTLTVQFLAAAHGIIVACTFCFNKIVRKQLVRILFPRKRRTESEMRRLNEKAYADLNYINSNG